MSERLDALIGRKSKDGQKTFWTKIGVAWPNKQGGGYTVVLDAMPAPEEGQFRISLFVPREDDARSKGGGKRADPNEPLDDTVPF